MNRRNFAKTCAGLALASGCWPRLAFADNRVRPTWLSFGLNGPGGSASRFPLTEALARNRTGKRGDFQLEVSESIGQLLRRSGNFVDFRDAVDFNSGTMLGAVLDYENVLSARLGASSFTVMHLVGHGVLLNFDQSRGWKMLSSFPFPVTLLRESAGDDVQAEAQKYLVEAFTGAQNSFAASFVKTAEHMAPKWSDSDRAFNVRVMSSKIHGDVAARLADWKLSGNINDVWFGHLASAAACEGMGIPIVPFIENQAFGKFTYKFSDRMVAQNVRLPDENDIDLRLHVTLRNIARDVKYRNQYQRWEVNRQVVIDVKALDDRNEEVLALRFGYQDEQPDTLAREEDLVPARDAHFFDMAIYRGLLACFSAIRGNDMAALARLFVKPNAEQQMKIGRFRSMVERAYKG